LLGDLPATKLEKEKKTQIETWERVVGGRRFILGLPGKKKTNKAIWVKVCSTALHKCKEAGREEGKVASIQGSVDGSG